MDLNESADIHVEAELDMEDKDVGRSGLPCRKNLEEDLQATRHFETDYMRKKQEEEPSSEQKIQRNHDSEVRLLLNNIKELENEKATLEMEIELLRKRNLELQQRTEKGDKKGGLKGQAALVELSGESLKNNEIIFIDDDTRDHRCIEIDVERKAAEEEVEFWKQNCGELESQLSPLLGESSNFSGKNVLSIDNTETNKTGLQDKLPWKGASWPLNVNADASKVKGTPAMTPEDLVNVKNECKPTGVDDAGLNYYKKARKTLSFVDDGISIRMAPITPAVERQRPKSKSIIDLIDSDEEQDAFAKVIHASAPRASKEAIYGGDKLEESSIMVEADDEEDGSSIQFLATPKRKRALKLVTSDSEAEDGGDDNIPISQVLKKNFQPSDQDTFNSEYTEPGHGLRFAGEEGSKPRQRRRLLAMRLLEKRNQSNHSELHSEMLVVGNADVDDEAKIEGIKLTADAKDEHSGPSYYGNLNSSTRRSQRLLKMSILSERIKPHKTESQSRIHPSFVNVLGGEGDGEMEENQSDDDDDSLQDFIVDDDCGDDNDDGGDSETALDNNEVSVSDEQEASSDSEVDLSEILQKIKRSKNHAPMEWEMVGDMLSAFGKDLEVCMKAVCALCRRQTDVEQKQEGAFVVNQRGFSKIDAARGTKLGKFLTNGDLEGDVQKSVEELRKYNTNAPEMCRTLAIRYSKQLFDIYQSEEDPFFRHP